MGKNVWDYIEDAKDYYDEYKHIIDPVVKTATSLGKSYLDYKSQKELNELSEKAYKDYMLEKEAAGQEAQAAIDLNLTPMQITNIPRTKADVTDFTAVAARGGLMNLPTRQRKRYYSGTGPEDIEIMDPESLGDFELQKEEGVNIGEQVFYDTGNPISNARQVWESGQIDQGLYQMDFNIFFQSGDWMDHISRGTVQGDMKMAKGPEDFMTNEEMQVPQEEIMAMIGAQQAAQGGIIGLRHGGRIGYAAGGDMAHRLSELIKKSNAGTITSEEENEMEQLEIMLDYGPGEKDGGRIGYRFGTPDTDVEIMDEEFVGDNELKMEEGVQIGPMAGGGDRGWRAQMLAEDLAQEQYGKEFYDLSHDKQMEIYTIALDMIDSGGMAKGGRIRKAPGGIMNLGGLEKDYRTTGGFVPIGGRERADDVPARLSKNEFVMTADAVRAAGGGSINKGAQRMYDTMKHLEASPQSKRMTA